MHEQVGIRLHTVSIVVTAEFHNPSILKEDFLVSRGIVPKDWTADQALVTPQVAVVKYPNGIAWTVDQSRLTVTENCGPAFGSSYLSHALVDGYIENLPYVPYRNLGLNCQVSTLKPKRWLVDRFTADWSREDPKLLGIRPAFALDAGDAVCNITLQESKRDDSPCVFAECNMHHEGPLAVDGLRAAIRRWKERQRFLDSALRKLLKDQSK